MTVERWNSGRPDRPPACRASASLRPARDSVVFETAMPSTPLRRKLHDDGPERVLGDVGRQLDDDRTLRLSRPAISRARASSRRCSSSFERGGILQVAQARRVGRGDVDREVAGDVVECLDAAHVVGDAVGRFLVGADVDADDAASACGACSRASAACMPAVVEAEPIDDGVVARQPEHARGGIAELRHAASRCRSRQSRSRAAGWRRARAHPCRNPLQFQRGWAATGRRT